MRTAEHAYGWEIEGLSRRLDALEDRLARRDRERLENTMMLFWVLWVAAIAGLIVLAALS